ncbi:MOSC domain-containing protein [Curvivirga aplysinae]|uniref:MOSC domain-containing protein n=1 Tax=Curvivirga aplysinae TaxID=2529852 RepID=UPI0012BD401B|nr:MOSC domain-containing protein [Curvivirga aplysinae]MTI11066.1 MOSC domain-containing protein [Curvivirga aplysinae]
MITIKDICRFPVKGLAADYMDSADLEPERGLPFDRKWGIIHAASDVDPAAVEWAPKKNFLQLAKDEKLAQLGLSFDEATRTVSILRKGRTISKGRLDEAMGRNILQTFLSGFVEQGPRGRPRIVEAPKGSSFQDVPTKWVSIINLASVNDLETRVIRKAIDPIRFRGNLYIEGAEAWRERNWLGKQLKIGDAVLEVTEGIGRCAATNVVPGTGEIDMNIPLSLRQGFDHMEMGVYAKVVEAGTIVKGQDVLISE